MAEPIVITQAEFRKQNAMLSDICTVCKNPIHIMCRKFTGICSENCDKQSKTTIKESE